MKERDPTGFARAVELDEAVRYASGMRQAGYLHHSRRPLSDVDLAGAGELPLGPDCTDGDCET